MIPTPGWLFIILCVLLGISCVLSSLSVSLITMSRAKLASLIQRDEASHLAKRLSAIEQDPDGHAAAIKILALFVNMLIGLTSIYWFSGILSLPTPNIGSVFVGILIATLVTWPATMLVPIGVANHAGERYIALLSRPTRTIHALFYPLLFTMRFIDEVIRRLAGTDLTPAEDAISSELLSVVSEGQREGHIDETERDMLEAVVEFRSTLAESVMTPRTEVDALEYTDDLDAVQQFIDEHGHSRAPVFEENLDHIVGMLYAKDLLGWIMANGPHTNNGQPTPFNLKSILRPPTFVPETKTVRELLAQLLIEKVHIAIIIDEYGGTSGLVTMEDIVEEIFGEIQDEYEDPEDDPSGVEIDEAATSAEIDARTEIDDANDDLEPLNIQFPESDDYDTVAGYINTTLGRIPDKGEQVTQDSMNIIILEAEPTRVLRIAVEPAPSDTIND